MAGVLAGLYLISKNRNSKPKADTANGIQLVYVKMSAGIKEQKGNGANASMGPAPS